MTKYNVIQVIALSTGKKVAKDYGLQADLTDAEVTELRGLGYTVFPVSGSLEDAVAGS